MRVLIVGNGGRESALAMKLQEDSRISKMYFAKGTATVSYTHLDVYKRQKQNRLRRILRKKINKVKREPKRFNMNSRCLLYTSRCV